MTATEFRERAPGYRLAACRAASFHGPRELGALEAAGAWRLPMNPAATTPGAGMAFGGFGAKSEE